MKCWAWGKLNQGLTQYFIGLKGVNKHMCLTVAAAMEETTEPGTAVDLERSDPSSEDPGESLAKPNKDSCGVNDSKDTKKTHLFLRLVRLYKSSTPLLRFSVTPEYLGYQLL